MIVYTVLLFCLVSITGARPNESIEPQNVVTVPPNCPDGQQWVNGQCRDIWRHMYSVPTNVITVPPNCLPGQEFINGQCRDVWRKPQIAQSEVVGAQENDDGLWPHNVITVPPNCRPGQQWINGACRDVWRLDDMMPVNVVTVPPNCPDGQVFVNGACRDIWRRASHILAAFGENRYHRQIEDDTPGLPDRNIINVPNQCPIGYKPDALGICRPVFDY